MTPFRTIISAVSAVALLVATSACSSEPATNDPQLTTVTMALDWTPNTNHTGIYVAQQKGWFTGAGIDLKILPYNTSAPETLIANHKADFGISYQEGITTARSAGQDLTSVYAVTQKTNVTIGVRANRTDINSPKDLDGKTYAGFGAPYEKPLLETVIRNAGGTGTFKTVTLNTAAYSALYAGKADFAMPMPTWEGVEAELRGEPFKNFQLADYGFPAIYSTLIASSGKYLSGNADTAKKVIAAIDRGYRFAITNPDEAGDLLIAANKAELTNTELVRRSERLLVAQYYRGPAGEVGTQSAMRWQDFIDFEFRAGLLVDANGKPLAQAPKAAEFFTNEYLPGG